MNWLLIIVILVLAGNIVWGFSKGFLRVVYSMLAWIAILIFVTWATPLVADMLAKTTNIDNRIEAGLNDKLHELVEGDTEEETETDTEIDPFPDLWGEREESSDTPGAAAINIGTRTIPISTLEHRDYSENISNGMPLQSII